MLAKRSLLRLFEIQPGDRTLAGPLIQVSAVLVSVEIRLIAYGWTS